MKRAYILLICIIHFTTSNAQDYIKSIFPVSNDKIVYTEVVTVDSTLSAEILYSRTRLWAKTASQSKLSMALDDFQGKTLLFNAKLRGFKKNFIYISNYDMKIKIELKDGKYRYTIYDFKCHYIPRDGFIPVIFELEKWKPDTNGIYSSRKIAKINSLVYLCLNNVDTQVLSVINQLKTDMSAPVDKW